MPRTWTVAGQHCRCLGQQQPGRGKSGSAGRPTRAHRGNRGGKAEGWPTGPCQAACPSLGEPACLQAGHGPGYGSCPEIGAEAIKKAGEAPRVDWRQVEDAVIAKSLTDDQQPADEVYRAIASASP